MDKASSDGDLGRSRHQSSGATETAPGEYVGPYILVYPPLNKQVDQLAS